MCRVLVAYATRGGSTREIAEAVADELRQTDHVVAVASCDDAPDVEGFDAVVIGSALYTGRWLPTATRYLRRQSPALRRRPAYLFQSGPCSPDPAVIDGTSTPRAVRTLTRRLGLAAPTTFAGRLDPTAITGRFSRWVATSVPAGDFRDWNAIRDWGYAIGYGLQDSPGRRTALPSPPERLPGTGPR